VNSWPHLTSSRFCIAYEPRNVLLLHNKLTNFLVGSVSIGNLSGLLMYLEGGILQCVMSFINAFDLNINTHTVDKLRVRD
jgi:hypothetical protein